LAINSSENVPSSKKDCQSMDKFLPNSNLTLQKLPKNLDSVN